MLVQVQRGDVEVDVLRDVRREALDLDLAQDEFEHAAFRLDALRDAEQPDGDGDADRLREIDPHEVHVNEPLGHGIALQRLDHDRARAVLPA